MSAEPRWATERTDRDTFGPLVVEVAKQMGYDPMPWQTHVLDVALEHVDGRLVYRDVVVSVPRQRPKTTTVFWMLVWRMLAAPSQAAYGAQSRLIGASEGARRLGAGVAPLEAQQGVHRDEGNRPGVDPNCRRVDLSGDLIRRDSRSRIDVVGRRVG